MKKAIGYTGTSGLLDKVGWSVGSDMGMMGCVWPVEGIGLVALIGISSDGQV